MGSLDGNEDFADYMDKLAASEEAARQRQEMYDAHENWRQTTWTGWLVRQIQSLAKHFRPFLDSIRDVMSADTDNMLDDDKSVWKVILYNMIRMISLFIFIGGIFALGQFVQKLIGTELIQEEEIIIVHEYATEEEAAKARAEQEKIDREQAERDAKAEAEAEASKNKNKNAITLGKITKQQKKYD